jgi:hypothetical protein
MAPHGPSKICKRLSRKEMLVGAVGIEPATLSQAVQCLCHSTSRKLVDGLLQQQRLQ